MQMMIVLSRFTRSSMPRHSNTSLPTIPILCSSASNKRLVMALESRLKKSLYIVTLSSCILVLTLSRLVLRRIQEAADKWGFVAHSMGLQWKDTEEANGSAHAKDEL
jgi:hypothetical protein